MKKSNLLAVLVVILVTTISNAQIGIGTTTPKTTLQVEGNPASTTTADGVQIPALSIAQLDAKVGAYSSGQDGALIYVNDVNASSTTSQTAGISETGFHYYEVSSNTWKKVGSPKPYSIGDFAHGGIVFWVDETGQHGLVCAIEDQSSGIKWTGGATGYMTGAIGSLIYAGKNNTLINIAVHNAKDNYDDNASRACKNYPGGGFGDWYLPSRGELDLMYQNKATIDATALANSGSAIASATYWSSTEFYGPTAFTYRFQFGLAGGDSKTVSHRVRAVRSF